MPNWCNNYLVLEHDDPEMITRARKAFNEGKLLEEFCPVPASLHIVAGSVGDPDEQKKLEEDNEDQYMNSPWADTRSMKAQMHGTGQIRWGGGAAQM